MYEHTNSRMYDWLGIVLAGLSAIAVLVALGMVFLYAPREATMGDVQRIFYFHVACAWVGFFAFFVTFVAGIGYLARGERRCIESPEQKARFATVYGIVAFVTVPLSWFAIRWWRTIHPDIMTGGEGMAMTPRMVQTLLASIAAFTLLYATLLRQRVHLERAADALARLQLRAEDEKALKVSENL
ncbi:MAG: hypothetical protein B6I35_09175 [Anaerolineaceae bacterium 4572_32.2]|nr:MAG: hypothetical protein B6I35_09175 [Anaerolineaceae bacterium 4572_32.2]